MRVNESSMKMKYSVASAGGLDIGTNLGEFDALVERESHCARRRSTATQNSLAHPRRSHRECRIAARMRQRETACQAAFRAGLSRFRSALGLCRRLLCDTKLHSKSRKCRPIRPLKRLRYPAHHFRGLRKDRQQCGEPWVARCCHAEPFDWLRTGSAKHLSSCLLREEFLPMAREILRFAQDDPAARAAGSRPIGLNETPYPNSMAR
jgi:hypothetical protein